MTEDQKKLLLKALDSLWGGLDASYELVQELADAHDGRQDKICRAISQSQDAIIALKESFGVEKF